MSCRAALLRFVLGARLILVTQDECVRDECASQRLSEVGVAPGFGTRVRAVPGRGACRAGAKARIRGPTSG
jgi:hypothetical protein